LSAQNPFEVAKDHYTLEFENEWVRISRVTYGPHETAPVHDHPSVPAVYIYTTDGGPILFKHDQIGNIRTPAVKAGQLRYARPNRERHDVEYLGDIATEYLRIELKTEPLGIPPRDFRSALDSHSADASFSKVDFENGQLRIVRQYCAPNASCTPNDDTSIPVIMVSLRKRQFRWIAPGSQPSIEEPGDYVRLELRSKPVLNP
jgi:hypothetical protein